MKTVLSTIAALLVIISTTSCFAFDKNNDMGMQLAVTMYTSSVCDRNMLRMPTEANDMLIYGENLMSICITSGNYEVIKIGKGFILTYEFQTSVENGIVQLPGGEYLLRRIIKKYEEVNHERPEQE